MNHLHEHEQLNIHEHPISVQDQGFQAKSWIRKVTDKALDDWWCCLTFCPTSYSSSLPRHTFVVHVFVHLCTYVVNILTQLNINVSFNGAHRKPLMQVLWMAKWFELVEFDSICIHPPASPAQNFSEKIFCRNYLWERIRTTSNNTFPTRLVRPFGRDVFT